MIKQNQPQIVILASRSPRRVELLKQIGIESVALPADIDETPKLGESPADYVQRVAKQKAIAAAKNLKSGYSHLPVLAADTTVALGSEIMGKPENDADAAKMLKKLSGSTHEVHTGVAVHFQSKTKVILSTTIVHMMRLTTEMIEAYIASGEQRDKAGSYAIQGKAAAWIERIEGSYSGVMGLPLYETAQLLKKIHK